MNREEYDSFYEALVAAEKAESKEWEKLQYFESCLPIEVLATRGRDTLRFGPMKPEGLNDPRTGKMPWAVVQLRKENVRADSYNLVGFQNHLKWGEQARVLRMIPGLENAKFLRYGQIHRNTYICAPVLLDELLRLKNAPRMSVCGADLGVEGYTESIATGMLAGIVCGGAGAVAKSRRRCRGERRWVRWCTTSRTRMRRIFSRRISRSICWSRWKRRRGEEVRDKKERHRMLCERALATFDAWWSAMPHPQMEPIGRLNSA